MTHDGPPLVRPVPRRPFKLPVVCATPPNDDTQPPRRSGSQFGQTGLSASRLLDVGPVPAEPVPPLSRPLSFRNLTSSTLMGIYSQAESDRDYALGDLDNPIDAPWVNGTRTPLQLCVDDAISSLPRHLPSSPRSSTSKPVDTASLPSTTATTVSLIFRAALLFLLGIGYGILVTQLHSENQHLADLTDGVIKPRASWGYLTFWGASGVVLGSLLPWLDKVWEDTPAGQSDAPRRVEADAGHVADTGTDWVLVMRPIGAFAGIVFAIVSQVAPSSDTCSRKALRAELTHPDVIQRKLAWASTLQVSLSLALVNPLLWWLIDRSKPGFLLSAGVGLAGSMLLLGVKPRMLPAPTMVPWQESQTSGAVDRAALRNATLSSLSMMQGVSAPVLGGFTSRETIETGVWVLSVLFCSCMCFGNIGRRLAWNRSAGGKGRWGGVR